MSTTNCTVVNFSIKDIIERIGRIKVINNIMEDLKNNVIFPRERNIGTDEWDINFNIFTNDYWSCEKDYLDDNIQNRIFEILISDNSELNNPDSYPDSEVIGQANAGGSNVKDYSGKVKEVTEDSQYVKLDLENGKNCFKEDDMDTSLDDSTASELDTQDMTIDEDEYHNNAIKSLQVDKLLTVMFSSLKRTKPLLSLLRHYTSETLPQLTKDRYPHIKRGNYAVLTQDHIRYFVDLLGQHRVLNDPSDCEIYNIDFIKAVRGYSQCVLKPQTTEEVSKILSFCNEHRLAVCPQGGNTGLVAGSVPVFDEVVLSTALMNNVISIDDISGVLVCEAGCVLEALDDTLAEKGLMMPLDLGAKGSCHIGGNVSTNAGGLRLIRYGNLHGSVLGVEAVKANGQIIDCLSTLKKDNTGYHLKHLFIGSEGTLGVVTKVAIQCPSKPTSLNLAFFGLESFDDILGTFKRAKKELGEILSSCEMIDAQSLDVVTGHLKLKSPIDVYPYYMLIETSGSDEKHDEEKLNRFLEGVMGDGLVIDGTVTNEPGKMRSIWELRERITEGLMYDGYCLRKDASRISGYGHIGDGNIHLNISVPEFRPDVLKKVEPYIYELTSQFKGSVSAEHGVGFRKPPYIHYSKSQNAIDLMKDLKKMMDPNNILNPYKVLPS
ncbi:hypothetical protein FQR65_LT03735 [Abscondita terminalis]|nr:hypothetical protein FQR65_LT03735 [Abscondita terminalis]